MDTKIVILTRCIARVALVADPKTFAYCALPGKHSPHHGRFINLWKARNRHTRVLLRRKAASANV